MNTPPFFSAPPAMTFETGVTLLHKAFERAGCKVFTQGQRLGASAGDVLATTPSAPRQERLRHPFGPVGLWGGAGETAVS